MNILEQGLKLEPASYIKIIDIIRLSGAKVRIVGGAIRDALLGKSISDIDIACSLSPEDTIKLLRSNGIKTIPTGVKFGTIMAIVDGDDFEITTLREDIDTDGRHAVVQFTDDFTKDAMRRDFTINALSYCPITKKIYDYFNGLEDLKHKRVRFIGDASTRISEDYLRILRFFRFSARYAEDFDQESLNACIVLKSNLTKLSKERIRSELDAILLIKNNKPTLALMEENDIFSLLFKGRVNYNSALHNEIIEFSNRIAINVSLEVYYAMLFDNAQDITINDLICEKFSRKQAKRICDILNLSRESELSEVEFKIKSRWLEEDVSDYYIFTGAKQTHIQSRIVELHLELKDKEKPIFPLSGHDLQKYGYAGKDLRFKLSMLKSHWIKSNFKASKDELLKLLFA